MVVVEGGAVMAGVLVDVEVANVDGAEIEVTGADVEETTEVVAVVLVERTQVPPTSMEDASHRIVETTCKIDVTGDRIDVTPRSPPVEVEGTQVPPTSIEDASHRIVETTGKIDVTGARIEWRGRGCSRQLARCRRSLGIGCRQG